jgi:ABC-type sugar transport system substrate-binding protein
VVLRHDLPLHLSERARGISDGLLEIAPDADIIGTYEGGTRLEAQNAITDLLERRVQFDLIITVTDIGAYGAVDALAAAEIPTDAVNIVSIEAESLARSYVEQGYYVHATMRVNRMIEAKAAVDALIKLLGGGETPQTIVIPIGEPFVMASSLLSPP